MSIFKIPEWVEKHMYSTKMFSDLSSDEIEDLQARLGRFDYDEPEVSVVVPAWNEQNNISGHFPH